MLFSDVWGSIVKMTNEMITEFKGDYPSIPIEFIDWETKANIQELPNADLIGPTALGITEETPEIIVVDFAIGVSTYQTDTNLFRQRDYLDRLFDRMRYKRHITLFDANTAQPKGRMVFTEGTTISPMTRAEARPFQYIQAECLLT
jgi:hypothetical protein